MSAPEEHGDALRVKLAAALAEMENVQRTAENTYHGSRYATLEDVIACTKPVLAQHGLAVHQMAGSLVTVNEDVIALEVHTSLIDAGDGACLTSTLQVPLGDHKKVNPQGFGSAVTYARRYALMAFFGLSAVDDDGEAAHGRRPEKGASVVLGDDWPTCPMRGVVPDTSADAKRKGREAYMSDLIKRIRDVRSQEELDTLIDEETKTVATLPKNWRVQLAEELRAQADYERLKI